MENCILPIPKKLYITSFPPLQLDDVDAYKIWKGISFISVLKLPVILFQT